MSFGPKAPSGRGKCRLRQAVSEPLEVWDLKKGRVMATYSCDSEVDCYAVARAYIVAGSVERTKRFGLAFSGRVHFLKLEEQTNLADTWQLTPELAFHVYKTWPQRAALVRLGGAPRIRSGGN
jgi:hypothetical protein